MRKSRDLVDASEHELVHSCNPTPDKLEKKKKIVHNSTGDDKCCSMKNIKK